MKEKMTMTIKCQCGYSWESESDLAFVTCPSCLKKTARVKP